MFRSLNGFAQTYISVLLIWHLPSQPLKSTVSYNQITDFGLLNSLLVAPKYTSVDTFKSKLKTFFFGGLLISTDDYVMYYVGANLTACSPLFWVRNLMMLFIEVNSSYSFFMSVMDWQPVWGVSCLWSSSYWGGLQPACEEQAWKMFLISMIRKEVIYM